MIYPQPPVRDCRRPMTAVRVFAAVVMTCCAVSVGCQSWGPSGNFASLTSARADKKTAQMAEHDPFPSPQDVGIE
ncbi:MAG: hypothetical protein KDA44_22650 [Planctomycetales bacterium]|nr:hypothetical protein [Planctomycetales bacterium]